MERWWTINWERYQYDYKFRSTRQICATSCNIWIIEEERRTPYWLWLKHAGVPSHFIDNNNETTFTGTNTSGWRVTDEFSHVLREELSKHSWIFHQQFCDFCMAHTVRRGSRKVSGVINDTNAGCWALLVCLLSHWLNHILQWNRTSLVWLITPVLLLLWPVETSPEKQTFWELNKSPKQGELFHQSCYLVTSGRQSRLSVCRAGCLQ